MVMNMLRKIEKWKTKEDNYDEQLKAIKLMREFVILFDTC